MADPPEESAPGGSARLAAQRARDVTTYGVRFPSRDLRARRGAAAGGEVPEARSQKGREILVAVAGAALLVREVARTDFGEHQEVAARRAWELLGGMLARLETTTPRMHEDLARRNRTLIKRIRQGIENEGDGAA